MRKYVFKNEDIQTIADATSKSFEQVVSNLHLDCDYDGHYYARNTRLQSGFIQAFNAAKQKTEYAEKVASGVATWKKHGGQWLVLVSGEERKPGSKIQVQKKDGTEQEKIIACTECPVDGGFLYKVSDAISVPKTATTMAYSYICDECGTAFNGRKCPHCGEDTMIRDAKTGKQLY